MIAPVTVTKNEFVGSYVEGYPCVFGQVRFGSCSQLNIAPKAVVDRSDETAPATTENITGCPWRAVWPLF